MVSLIEFLNMSVYIVTKDKIQRELYLNSLNSLKQKSWKIF